MLLDYDNDGWLDILAIGDGVRVWRNRGNARFEEVTRQLGLDKLVQGKVQSITAADFDQDGDTDLLVTLQDQSLRLLRNDGGNANQQLKLHLIGTKSNASALGTRLEVNAGGLRLSRRISTLPIEIGVGKNKQLDSLTVHWFDFPMNAVDVKVEPRSVLALLELEQQGGSCPYLYAWDGQRFRFITDILSASPVGLPLSENRLIEADTQEFAWIGDDKMFPPRDGNFVLQITEELREVLYLDEARLTIVDHPPGTEVHTTSKLRPGKPFPPPAIVTLHERKPLLQATRSDGLEVTTTLAQMDEKFISPPKLRSPQLRGLAESHSFTLDFGLLETERPLVLALTGWLRFGGGTANVAASQDPDLPFPFPTLEVETGSDAWQPVEVIIGAPAGKIKTIVVDLTGKLPPGSKRLRLTEAFELYWDRIALFERRAVADTKIYSMAPAKTDLHWRGYSDYSEMPGLQVFLPVYDQRSASPPWRITPAGWCTRYGNVDALVNQRDNALAIINGGDELTLSFAAKQVPAKSSAVTLDFFLFSVGWEKDSDFHVTKGVTVEPLPWHGMDDQLYGQQLRPAFSSDELMKKYNTRWVGPYSVTRGK